MKNRGKITIGIIVLLLVWASACEEKIRIPENAGENIICFGDSLTYGTGASEGMDYPSQLSRMLDRPVINVGVPGETTADALARMEEDVLENSPQIVLITLGGNDLKNRVDRETARLNLTEIVKRIQQRNALVIIGGIDVPFWGRGFGQMYEQVADETGAVLIPNLFKGVLGNRSLMSDPIHPNDRGYTVFAEKFFAEIPES
jgi:acyl-CoA thioesterase-1